ncbi:MAG: hypothetical protein QOK71_02920 [Nitrososphaeraceae archaeon]|jgi:hypothetical protein|nr:hypothetical protein [Nitrososphaeraceae archaeon]MDW3603693.1 hypothetical protein [Nitrososphaeraceae archaeon]MDW3630367.1 hypothetical protein [Nitrososphaeraceae archaeon]
MNTQNKSSTKNHTRNEKIYKIKIFNDSIKFYLPRVEGYNDIIKDITLKYGALSIFEFDGYFEGKFEPTKYIRVEIHTNDVNTEKMIEFANEVRIKLKQTSLAFEFNNNLILVESDN